uniref:Uncharacterized protein n=1 Tax=Parascaris equorum TaxID=6256 RepID=A0A914RAL2_PAREQ
MTPKLWIISDHFSEDALIAVIIDCLLRRDGLIQQDGKLHSTSPPQKRSKTGILIDEFAATELCMKSLEHVKVDTSDEARQDGIDFYK